MIPFPKMHIAESVLNRIFNALDDSQPMFPSFNPPPPITVDPVALGGKIEQATETPAPPVAMSDDPVEAGAAQESILGGSPLAGAVAGLMQG